MERHSTPSNFSVNADVANSSRDASGLAPPPKSRHPEGFPEAGDGPATGQPTPLEEDKQGGGWDESGMAPEFVVTIPEELVDLNVQPVTMDQDRESDSPHPPSPRQAAALDQALEGIVPETQEVDWDVEVLREVPSTQPATPPLFREPSQPQQCVQLLEPADRECKMGVYCRCVGESVSPWPNATVLDSVAPCGGMTLWSAPM